MNSNHGNEANGLGNWMVRSAGALLAVAAISGTATQAADWRWTVTPYAWATDIGVDVKIDDESVIDETIPVEDLLEDLETVFSVHAEAQKGEYGVMIDLFDVTLEDHSSDLQLPLEAGQADLVSEIGMTILDFAGTFDPKGDQQGVSFYFGTRILNQRATIDAEFALNSGADLQRRFETDDTLVDGLVGVRLSKRFSKRWSYQMQADVSLGQTEYTWSVGPTIAYQLGSSGRYALTAGYKRMKIDFEDEGALDTELTMSGATLGFRFSF
jgi:hypothetical protein